MQPLTAVLTSAAMLSVVMAGDAGAPEPMVVWAVCLTCKQPAANLAEPLPSLALTR